MNTEILLELVDVAERIVNEATSVYETLPPHELYYVDGELIRKLSDILEKFYISEE